MKRAGLKRGDGVSRAMAGMFAALAVFWAVNTNAAAVAASVTYTNRVESFLDLQGNIYADATLVRAEFDTLGGGRIVYKTNGDYNVINFSRLSPQTMINLGVPTNHAQIARDAEEQKRQAAVRELQANAEEQGRLLDPTNLMPIKIDSIVAKIGYDAVYGQLYSCKAHLGKNPGQLNILVAKLPPEIGQYYQQVKQQEDAVNGLKNQIAGAQSWATAATYQLNQQQYQINQAQAQVMAGTSGFADWVYPAASQRYAVDQANQVQKQEVGTLTNVQQQIATDQEQLATMQSQLTTLKNSETAATTRLMLPGRRAFNGFKVFICAPDSVQPPPDEQKTAEGQAPPLSTPAGTVPPNR